MFVATTYYPRTGKVRQTHVVYQSNQNCLLYIKSMQDIEDHIRQCEKHTMGHPSRAVTLTRYGYIAQNYNLA